MSLKYEITEDWRAAWKWFQAQLGIAIAVAPEVYNYLQSDPGLQGMVPASVFRHTMAVLGLLVLLNAVRKKGTA